MPPPDRDLLTSNHWGTYRVKVKDGQVTALRDFGEDRDPSPIGAGVVGVLEDETRIKAPMVRKGWLEGGPGSSSEARGKEDFVEVSWETVNSLVAGELKRVIGAHGNSAIYAGSYGWASAGRFHHAQSQLKRFLNCIGGFTSSRNTYSFAAAEVVVPHILGTYRGHLDRTTSWDSIASDCALFVAFGGVPLKNGQISQGGTGAHVQQAGLLAAQAAGVEFINISPLREDIDPRANPEWLAIRPSTDVALMLALCQVLLAEGLQDQDFLDRYTHGFEAFADYLKGAADGIEKSPEWAAAICDLPAQRIRNLARQMARSKTMISVAWALTRQDHGEQTFWAAIALAAMLGQMGLPGTGLGFGYSAMNDVGLNRHQVDWASVPQGQNPVPDFIPVARVTEMLENPGGAFDYNGQRLTYPDIRLVWWAGGNPFHHHQDLNRMRRAWSRPETVIVNEWCWNALARYADIVLPCTTPLERQDIAMTPKDPYVVAMDRAIDPVGEARDDHAIFCGIAGQMGVAEAFTDGRTAEEWLQWLWSTSRQRAAAQDIDLPDWGTLQRDGWCRVPEPDAPSVMLKDFRDDPVRNALATPSGRIELFSDTIAGFGYDDCPGHPAWLTPAEWLGEAGSGQLHLISNQPKNKLHSQLDHGAVSQADRPKGHERVLMNTSDAAGRGLEEGQIVCLSNLRGECLAELRVSEGIRPGVLQMATGAWYTPQGRRCIKGNPNVLTLDKGTSRLAQGPIAHSCLVEVQPVVPAPG